MTPHSSPVAQIRCIINGFNLPKISDFSGGRGKIKKSFSEKCESRFFHHFRQWINFKNELQIPPKIMRRIFFSHFFF